MNSLTEHLRQAGILHNRYVGSAIHARKILERFEQSKDVAELEHCRKVIKRAEMLKQMRDWRLDRIHSGF